MHHLGDLWSMTRVSHNSPMCFLNSSIVLNKVGITSADVASPLQPLHATQLKMGYAGWVTEKACGLKQKLSLTARMNPCISSTVLNCQAVLIPGCLLGRRKCFASLRSMNSKPPYLCGPRVVIVIHYSDGLHVAFSGTPDLQLTVLT